MLSRLSSTSSAIPLHVPPVIHPSGSMVEGHVAINLRLVHEEDIDEVQVRLRGVGQTRVDEGDSSSYGKRQLVRDNLILWTRGSAYPEPGSDVLPVPFSFKLPAQLPPSFLHRTVSCQAAVRYSVTAVGVRRGILHVNKRQCVPLTVIPTDTVGASIKRKNATHSWRTYSKDERIRRGLWGAYSTVSVQLSLPDILMLPLSSTIPYTITVTTKSPPLTRAQAAARPLFPPIPDAPDALEFVLRRRMFVRAGVDTARPTTDAAHFLGAGAQRAASRGGRARPPVSTNVDGGQWLPAAADAREKKGRAEEGKGTWVQRAVFESTFSLDVAPSFEIDNFIVCSYELVVRVPFPGVGNDLKLEVPVVVTSGIDAPLPRSGATVSGAAHDAPTLDLPPAYWDPEDAGWRDDEKV
ncbi:uncharacterized protein BXZ73DRAFT_99613 [Epithele typhae]|uniref:uncharacterized protein n=1 Tax=Epithele typhae TaxID=378194 RepID=UPI0020075DE2|nr:uncharacterized protein BXZ73DRAFT_99613 [Epithele typhae]KAH9939408.1 hypothetical protein BXZ73DRAFT_99613 [Epithele typhae]